MIQLGTMMKPGPLLHFGPGPAATDASSAGGYGHTPAPGPGGFTPDYSGNILNDPLYAALQRQVTAQNQSAQAGLTTGFGQGLAQYGQIPDLGMAAQQLGLDANSPIYKLLMGAATDPNTVASAHALTAGGLSTSAGLDQQHQTALGGLLSNLAARGAVQSGDTGTGLRLEDQANSQRQYAAQQALLQHLGSLIGTYNTSQQQGIGQLQSGAAQAAARQIALNPSVPGSLATSIASMLGAGSVGGATNGAAG